MHPGTLSLKSRPQGPKMYYVNSCILLLAVVLLNEQSFLLTEQSFYTDMQLTAHLENLAGVRIQREEQGMAQQNEHLNF